ncbi:MAG: ketopantoate reductase family protein [Erysipelotrichaceae bacterium]|nr:ketopantoate reductase family protein [Erysipelotrichaceae bacterium]
MKILIYGAGVIGGQLCHALCSCGNDVTVVARGAWADTLRKEGLRIHHYIQRKDTVDHPRVIDTPDETRYDAVFAVMQYRQMEKILSGLARINTPVIILTGNNLSAPEMEERIHAESPAPKTVLFGFGSTAGTRENGKLTTVHTGDGLLTIGKAKENVPEAVKTMLAQVLSGSRMSVVYCDNMDAWLKYHAAFILPVVYLCYKTGCDLKKSTRADRKLMLDAAGDAYHLLMALGYPVRPAGDEKTLEPGFARTVSTLLIYAVAKTRLGALCTTEHCRHAPGEMKDLDDGFQMIRSKMPGFRMPAYDRLRAMMPSWEEILKLYGN